MSDAALAALKLCFLAGLYLFLLRLLRAVWVEISDRPAGSSRPPGRGATATRTPERPAKGRGKKAQTTMQLKVAEPPAQRGTRYPVADEMTIGRGNGCAVHVDDSFASQLHARVFRRDGTVFVEDLGSTNGTFLNRKKVHGPVPMHPGDRLQVGHTVLEVER